MHRIDTPGNVGGLFVPPNPATGQIPVVVDSDWLNDLQENVARLIEYVGIALVKGDYTQLRKAILALAGVNYANDTGAANALVAALATPPLALTDGLIASVHVANLSTGPATLNLNGLGAVAITSNGRPLEPGALRAGAVYALVYSGGAWQMLSPPYQDWQRQPAAGNYLFTAADHDRSFYRADAGTPTYTLPDGASAGVDDGWRVRLFNDASAGAMTLTTGGSDQLWWMPTHTLGARTLAAGAWVDIEHVTTHQYWVRGAGIS